MSFKDFRDPIEYVVDQYFQRKRNAQSNNTDNSEGRKVGQYLPNEDNLPDAPCLMLYNRGGDAYKFIYGEYDALRDDPLADVFLWQQEIIYNEFGDAIRFETTYPNGYVMREILVEDENGKLQEIRLG